VSKIRFQLPRPSQRHRSLFRPTLEALEQRLVPTNLPPGFQDNLFASGVPDAACLGVAPDGRLFVCQMEGNLRVIEPNGTVEPQPFLHVDTDYQGEHGLVGMTFDPDFVHNGYVYIYYTTADAPIHCRVSRFTADPTNPNVALPGSEKVLLELDNLTHIVHVGGGMHFGKDGKLYIGVGEDGNPANSQDGSNLLGKMLRINPDGSVPADNPFVGYPDIRPEIYAFGFRNPYRFAVNSRSGLTYVNDVGSDPPEAHEEVNRLYWGGNYGWPIYEGYSGDPNYTDPLYTYVHQTDPETGTYDCAVTGAAFYAPGARPFPRPYVGQYFFADLCGNWIRQYNPQTGAVSVFASDTDQLTVDLAEDAQGSLFYLGLLGTVHKIKYSGAPPTPGHGVHLGATAAFPGQAVGFSYAPLAPAGRAGRLPPAMPPDGQGLAPPSADHPTAGAASGAPGRPHLRATPGLDLDGLWKNPFE
jgi:glucose/arabinose dehydrogenase